MKKYLILLFVLVLTFFSGYLSRDLSLLKIAHTNIDGAYLYSDGWVVIKFTPKIRLPGMSYSYKYRITDAFVKEWYDRLKKKDGE